MDDNDFDEDEASNVKTCVGKYSNEGVKGSLHPTNIFHEDEDENVHELECEYGYVEIKKDDIYEVDVESFESTFDEDHLSHQYILQIMNEKMNDNFLFGMVSLIGIENQVDDELFVIV